jgi:D-aspartate ligase
MIRGMQSANHPGALVIGGQHPGLGIARSLGRRGIRVNALDDQLSVSRFSRYVERVVRVKDLRSDRATIDALLEMGHTFGLDGWVLFPTRDEHVNAIARNRDELAKQFRVTTPVWDTVKWAWDKTNSYVLAQRLGIPTPQTWSISNPAELDALFSRLPLAIKPAVKEHFFYATGAKAWRVETAQQLRDLYDKAARQIALEQILIQEIIPGDGDRQFSFCAFCRQGRVHSSLVARRHRQHPREFGRAATYVESTESAVVEELAQRFIEHIAYDGLVEIEFKLDPRDGQYKLLDVNARTWGFHTLGVPAGVDFAYLQYADQVGLPIERSRGRAGVGWLRFSTDLPTALADIATGHLSVGGYVGSLRRTRTESVFCARDPLPSIGELLILPYLAIRELLKTSR